MGDAKGVSVSVAVEVDKVIVVGRLWVVGKLSEELLLLLVVLEERELDVLLLSWVWVELVLVERVSVDFELDVVLLGVVVCVVVVDVLFSSVLVVLEDEVVVCVGVDTCEVDVSSSLVEVGVEVVVGEEAGAESEDWGFSPGIVALLPRPKSQSYSSQETRHRRFKRERQGQGAVLRLVRVENSRETLRRAERREE